MLSECIELILELDRFFGYLSYSLALFSFANVLNRLVDANGFNSDDEVESLKEELYPRACCLISGELERDSFGFKTGTLGLRLDWELLFDRDESS